MDYEKDLMKAIALRKMKNKDNPEPEGRGIPADEYRDIMPSIRMNLDPDTFHPSDIDELPRIGPNLKSDTSHDRYMRDRATMRRYGSDSEHSDLIDSPEKQQMLEAIRKRMLMWEENATDQRGNKIKEVM